MADLDGKLRLPENQSTYEFPDYIDSAGLFELDHDVTLLRHRQLKAFSYLSKDLSKVPYRIYSRDILLEGIGWVEVVAQVRTPKFAEQGYPVIEVLSPLGEGIGSRPPMGADMILLGSAKEIGKFTYRRPNKCGRPRSSKKGHKRLEKNRRRVGNAVPRS